MKIIANLITLTPWGKEHMKRSTKRPPASPIIASSSLRKVFGLFCTLLLCLAAPAGHAENRRPTSVYTSVKPTDCHVPPPPLVTAYEARGLAVRECQAPKGWRLFVVSTDECSWLELSRDGLLWSTEEQVVYRNNFGNFPNLGADKVEWCLRKAKKELGELGLHRGLIKINGGIELAEKHILKAEHNLKGAIYFKKGGFSDWSASAFFYCIYHKRQRLFICLYSGRSISSFIANI